MKAAQPMTILCSTDLSESSRKATDAAAALAVLGGQRLLLVHVADEFNAHADTKEELAAYLSPIRQRIRDEAKRLRKAGAEVEAVLLHGSVAEKAIRKLVDSRFPSLVAVSSVDKSAFERWAVGSVSEGLSQHIRPPTLIVRDAKPFEAWARGERALKVFVAADLGSASESALLWVRELCRMRQCDVTVAYVDRSSLQRKRLGSGTVRSPTENPPKARPALERDLREKSWALLGSEDARVLIKPAVDRADEVVIEQARQSQADLLVVGTHQRPIVTALWHHPISRNVVSRAPMSVACVPTGVATQHPAPVPQIRRVLVATDFSPLGDRAIPYAYALVGERGTVFLVHVTRPLRLPSLLRPKAEARMDAVRKEHAARLREAAERLQTLIPIESTDRRHPGGIATASEPRKGARSSILSEVQVIEGTDPARAIFEAAEQCGADIICLGSHGRSGLSAALMGSVAQALVAQCRRPVLLVREPVE